MRMRIKWYYSKILRQIFKIGEWNIAIRSVDQKSLECEDKPVLFFPIEYNSKYWFADPILFENDGVTWLFVEAYDRLKQKGEIGVFNVENAKCVNYKSIIEMDYHMSYPFVFKKDDNIYMIPETGNGKILSMYKAKCFPYEWELDCILDEGKAYRDTTLFFVGDESYLFTYLRKDNNLLIHNYHCLLYKLDFETKKLYLIEEYEDKMKNMRPAGDVYYTKQSIIHASQKCDKIYGESIIFWESLIDIPSWRKAKIIKSITAKDVKIDTIGHPLLIHTYTRTKQYEVIDYRIAKSWGNKR